MGKKRGGNRLEEPKRRSGFKVLLTTFFILSIVVGGVYIWLRYFVVVAPDIPSAGDENGAFSEGEWNEDDARFDGNRAPAGVTESDRKKDFFTVLIIGIDSGVSTDTIMIASFDNTAKEANLISIPRDTLVNVSRKTKKINAAYPSGTLNGGGREGGIAQLQREIKTLIGFVPDYTLAIDLKGFEKIIDTVGGIEIDVPFHMRYHDPVQNLNINISKGKQSLSGADALKFARYRRGNNGGKTISDFERMANQQAVVKALLGEVMKPGNLLKIPEFSTIFSENVYTELKAGNLVWFGEQIAKLRGTDALSTYTIPMNGGSGSPGWYEYIDPAAALELINKTVNPYTKPILPEHVDILTAVP